MRSSSITAAVLLALLASAAATKAATSTTRTLLAAGGAGAGKSMERRVASVAKPAGGLAKQALMESSAASRFSTGTSSKAFERVQAADAAAVRKLLAAGGAGAGRSMEHHVARVAKPAGGLTKQALMESSAASRFAAEDKAYMATQADAAEAVAARKLLAAGGAGAGKSMDSRVARAIKPATVKREAELASASGARFSDKAYERAASRNVAGREALVQ